MYIDNPNEYTQLKDLSELPCVQRQYVFTLGDDVRRGRRLETNPDICVEIDGVQKASLRRNRKTNLLGSRSGSELAELISPVDEVDTLLKVKVEISCLFRRLKVDGMNSPDFHPPTEQRR